MILNPEWLKPKEKPYFHQISLDCIEKLVDCMEGIDIENMDCVTCFKMQEMLSGEIDDSEFLNFAIDNFSVLFSYIASGKINIRICRDIEVKMWLKELAEEELKHKHKIELYYDDIVFRENLITKDLSEMEISIG